MHSLKTATFNDTSCNRENNLFVLKNFSSKKRSTIFCDNFFSHNSCDEKLFLPVFLFTHFCVLKNVAKKSIRLTWLMNLFFVIKTVLHLLITTFFECEMKISFINTITESKNMEDSERFPLKRE